MATVEQVSRPGAPVACELCRAGRWTSFNWARASDHGRGGDLKPGSFASPGRSAFDLSHPLRQGTLYRCKACGRSWYLDGTTDMMSLVPEDRVSLILAWNEHAICLSKGIVAKLDGIGRTPPDKYGNGRQYREIPCGVITSSGERVDPAIVSFQTHAPFEPWRHCRLGSEISEVYPSPYALPLPVRIATSEADEIRMGFAPTVIEMPDERFLILNWRPNFLVKDGFRAEEARVSRRRLGSGEAPEIVSAPAKEVTYFIADG
jgi:hypothetical protein